MRAAGARLGLCGLLALLCKTTWELLVSESENEDFGSPSDDSHTVGSRDDTVNSFSNSGRPDSAPPGVSGGPKDGTIISGSDGNLSKEGLADFSSALSGFPKLAVTEINYNATVNSSLAELAGVQSDAIRPLEGRFSLFAKLAKGGMGEVFAARDSMLNREVAVKVLTGEKSAGLARFIREAQVTAQLSHPNVVPVYGLEETDQGSPALTMKLVHGITFARYIEQCSSATGTPEYDPQRHGENGRIEHFLRVCDAMSYSHSRGVIHRDLKPDNLIDGLGGNDKAAAIAHIGKPGHFNQTPKQVSGSQLDPAGAIALTPEN